MAGESQMTPKSEPDPTVYVQEAIDRAAKAIRDDFTSQLAIRDMRFAGMDEANRILSETVNRVPTVLQTEIGHIKELTASRFADLDLRYQQRFDSQQVALKDALSAAEKAVTAALTAADRAVAKAETAAEKRFESINEFRSTLSDQARELIPRAEAAARFSAQDAIIANLTKTIDRQEGKTNGLNAGWGYLVGVVGLVAALVGIMVVVISNSGTS